MKKGFVRNSIVFKKYQDELYFGKIGLFYSKQQMPILLYWCITCMLTEPIEKKLDENCTRMIQVILNKYWKLHLMKQQLYSHLPPIYKTIQIKCAGHCWRSKEELISDVLRWTSSHGHASVYQATRTYLQQLCMDTECSLEDLPEVMEDKDK